MHQHGFTLVRESDIPELSSRARLWRHDDTGARLLSLCNRDVNKVFGVSFRTPPADSTGVAHILEHSVLCGSARYPVKEPFVELLKGSLQTFLNAFTYPDKTCYPVASTNLADFRNLTDVYLDAVFFPRITDLIFEQEGWHLEADCDAGPFCFKGVVYNEMKGAFSAPESVLGRYCLHSLFPDTVYALESGGDPRAIPQLTYEAFRDFHRTYYHPSNAWFYFWGDDPEEERLARINEVVSRFRRLDIASSIGVQKRLSAPRRVSVPFAAAAEGDKGMAVINWLGPDVMDMELNLAFRMLEHILLGMPASPLRRALIESGLGEDLAGQGLETELRQLAFDAGLKGLDPQDVDKLEDLVLATLQELADAGIARESVEAAVNSVEFMLRENNTGRFPVGLSVMLRALTTWLHDGDPMEPLRFEEPLARIKARVASGERYFEDIIRVWLLDNPHRVTVVLQPDTGLEKRQEAAEQEEIRLRTQDLDPAGRQAVAARAAALREWQAAPDSPEALATIPRLEPDDLPRDNAVIPTVRLRADDVPLLFHPLPTGGIVYAEACFDLVGVSQSLLPLVPLLGRALFEMGTTQKDFVELNLAIARKTGGMEADPVFLTRAETRAPVARLIVSGKAAPDKADDLFGLLEEVVTGYAFSDRDRFVRMVLEEKARMEHSLVPAGHMVVASRLKAGMSGAGWLSEITGGVSYLGYLRSLAQQAELDWPAVRLELETLAALIFNRRGCLFNITAPADQEDAVRSRALCLAAGLPQHAPQTAWWEPETAPANEGLILPAQVNYVGTGVNLFDAGYVWHGSAAVILKHLRTGYLWEKVRVQGGAYGCVCGLDRMSGVFFMVSYRDPNVLPTLDIYHGTAEYLQTQRIAPAELNSAIVGAIGELDAHMLPDAQGNAALVRFLTDDTVARRRQLREEILSTTPAHFYEFGRALEALSAHGRVCALGGNAVEKAARDQGWETLRVL